MSDKKKELPGERKFLKMVVQTKTTYKTTSKKVVEYQINYSVKQIKLIKILMIIFVSVAGLSWLFRFVAHAIFYMCLAIMISTIYIIHFINYRYWCLVKRGLK